MSAAEHLCREAREIVALRIPAINGLSVRAILTARLRSGSDSCVVIMSAVQR